jgi:hypothetical protein
MALPSAQRKPPHVHVAPLPEIKRQDRWWLEPVLVVTALTLFTIYAVWRGFEAQFYDTARMGLAMHYLSPFYSPPIQDWTRFRWPISPAFYVLIFPLSFRFSCYFCRRSTYRAIFWDPPACAVQELAKRHHYTGERAFPLVGQNFHRYALFAILVFVAFHWVHVLQACCFADANGTHFGVGLGTLILALDATLLSLYVFSCHSFRHLVGGVVNRFSNHKRRFALWEQVSRLNARHGLFFWLSLFSVGLADFYVRLVCSGVLHDSRLF